jgi:hypothetical protein
VALQPVPEGAVFLAGAGHHGDEPATPAGDVPHRLSGAQLAVRDVEEVDPAQQRDQTVPGRDVRRVIDGVAVGQAVGDRDGPVRADGEDPDQLLEVGSVVLRVPLGDHRGWLAGTRGAVGVAVAALHADRRRVVVQPGGVDTELADRGEHDRGQQAGPVSIEQRVQRPADPIIVDGRDFDLGQAQQRRVIAGCPLAQRVERFAAQHQVRDHQPDRGRGCQLGPAVDLVQGVVQQPRQAEAVQDVVHDRHAAQRV